MFSQMNDQEKKELKDMKTEVQKISGEHLASEQLAFGLGEQVINAENDIGFKELLRKR